MRMSGAKTSSLQVQSGALLSLEGGPKAFRIIYPAIVTIEQKLESGEGGGGERPGSVNRLLFS